MVKIHTGGDVLWQSPRTQCYTLRRTGV